jgi:hypothetical protein
MCDLLNFAEPAKPTTTMAKPCRRKFDDAKKFGDQRLCLRKTLGLTKSNEPKHTLDVCSLKADWTRPSTSCEQSGMFPSCRSA